MDGQILFFSVLAQMLSNGFAINETLHFMQNFLPKQRQWIIWVEKQLSAGKTFTETLRRSGIKSELVDQLIIAQQHGQLIGSLKQIVNWLKIKGQHLKKLQSLMNYPILLFMMLIGFYVGMKVFIQPQLKAFGTQSYRLPVWFTYSITGIGSCLILFMVGLICYLRRLDRYQRLVLLSKFPIIGKPIQNYCGYLLCSDLAIFLRNGLNLADILQAVHQLPPQSFIYELGKSFENQLQQGQNLESAIKKVTLVPNELLTFVHRGSSLSLLAEEMQIYSQLLFDRLIEQVNKILLAIQPITFIMIATIILIMYLQLLMPIYHTIGSM